eukprot:gene10171-11210_t
MVLLSPPRDGTDGFRWRCNGRGCSGTKPRLVDWFNYTREECTHKLLTLNIRLGGPGRIVEIDESVMIKRKYNRGARRPGLRSHHVISAPEVFYAGDKNSITVALIERTGDTLVHAAIKKWHGGKIIASSAKFIPIAKSNIPFILEFQIPEDALSVKHALLVLRLLGNQYRTEERLVQIKKRPVKIFIKTNKGIYQYNDKVSFWIIALDRGVKSVNGKVDSAKLMVSKYGECTAQIFHIDSDGNVADYKKDIPLFRGIAVSNLSTKNIASDGKVQLKVTIQEQEASVILFVGDFRKQQDKRGDKKTTYFRSLYRQSSISALAKHKSNKSNKQKPYSISNARIEILFPKRDFKPGSIAKFVVVYNNPSIVVNAFFYQVVCSDKTLLFERFQDLYSPWACEFEKYHEPFLYSNGPRKVDLCRERKAWFSVCFKITDKMAPSCRLLVYGIKNEVELVAADEEFRVSKDLPRNLELKAEKRAIYTNETVSIEINGAENGKVLLAGLYEKEKFDDEHILCEDALLHYSRNRSSLKGAMKISTFCDGYDYVTASQYFRNSRLEVMTDVIVDPDIPCWKNSKIYRRMRSTNKLKSGARQIAGNEVQPWIWKVIQLRDVIFYRKGEYVWKYSFNAPTQAGKYKVEAFSMDEDGKLGVAKSIVVEVKEMGKNRTGTEPQKPDVGKRVESRDLVTFKILPDYESRFFVLNQCQPMKMKICISGNSSSGGEADKSFVVIQINMVPGFRLKEVDLKKKPDLINWYWGMGTRSIMGGRSPTVFKSSGMCSKI